MSMNRRDTLKSLFALPILSLPAKPELGAVSTNQLEPVVPSTDECVCVHGGTVAPLNAYVGDVWHDVYGNRSWRYDGLCWQLIA